MYWPKDFKNDDEEKSQVEIIAVGDGSLGQIVNTKVGDKEISENGKIEAYVEKGSGDAKLKIGFIDNTTNISAKSGNYVDCSWDKGACMGIYNLCG